MKQYSALILCPDTECSAGATGLWESDQKQSSGHSNVTATGEHTKRGGRGKMRTRSANKRWTTVPLAA